MCIRDRREPASRKAPDAWLKVGYCQYELRDVAAARATLRALIARHPVSYTHLRAHETVLDIVCRLLLEKKTITQYTTCAANTQR